jgi:UDP-galactopyranose mutase
LKLNGTHQLLVYQNAGRSNNIKIDVSFERLEEFKYLGKALTNQISIQEEIKSRLKSRNACYHLVQSFVFQVVTQK